MAIVVHSRAINWQKVDQDGYPGVVIEGGELRGQSPAVLSPVGKTGAYQWVRHGTGPMFLPAFIVRAPNPLAAVMARGLEIALSVPLEFANYTKLWLVYDAKPTDNTLRFGIYLE